MIPTVLTFTDSGITSPLFTTVDPFDKSPHSIPIHHTPERLAGRFTPPAAATLLSQSEHN